MCITTALLHYACCFQYIIKSWRLESRTLSNEITSLYHPSLSISKKKIKRNPYLPYLFLVGMSPEPDLYFYLASCIS